MGTRAIRWALALGLLLGAAACDGGGGETTDADASADPGPAEVAGSPDADASSDPGPIGACGPLGQPRMTVIQSLRFARESESGAVWGIDIDGAVTAAGDPTGCGRADFTSPSGQPGVDNQFATLAPILDELGGSSLDEPVETAIRTGELLLLVELQSVDDLVDDACLSVEIFRGAGQPSLGTNGLIVPGQSFDIDLERPWSRTDEASITAGHLRAGPFPLQLPLTFFATSFTLDFDAAWLDADLDPETGELSGVLAAQASVEALLDAIEDIDPNLASTATLLLADAADLDPDAAGTCRSISLAFEVRAVSAHLYPDTARPEAGTEL
ncbi:MAG: hypothetical protein H6744_17160 [Deltaproteobacteria bacterium]|nr:hypothetical protein [Deltaproteobacteria bacterium]MCB9788413.1 hypothetical protein [Deltaproteobacteria bacterium]